MTRSLPVHALLQAAPDGPTLTILGIEIPDAGPVFLMALAVHILAGMIAVITATIAALARKRRGRHPRAGTAFLAAVAVIVATAAVMATIRWEHNRHLLAIAVVTAGLASVGWLARRHRWRHWMLWHGIAMSGAFIALLTGFYVDNGPQLPIWNRLPQLAFWFLPAAVGIPLTWWALRRNHAIPSTRRDRNVRRRDGTGRDGTRT